MRNPFYVFLMALALVAGSCQRSTETVSTTGTVSTDATTDTTPPPATTTAVPPADFVTDAGQASMTEIAGGKLALEKSTNADVRAFGERMIKDHTLLNEQLKPLAQALSLPFPTSIDPGDQHMLDELAKLSGSAFDAMYANDMLKGHEGAVTLFGNEAQFGTNAELKAWAARSVLIIDEHLILAKELQSKVK